MHFCSGSAAREILRLSPPKLLQPLSLCPALRVCRGPILHPSCRDVPQRLSHVRALQRVSRSDSAYGAAICVRSMACLGCSPSLHRCIFVLIRTLGAPRSTVTNAPLPSPAHLWCRSERCVVPAPRSHNSSSGARSWRSGLCSKRYCNRRFVESSCGSAKRWPLFEPQPRN